MLEQLKVTDSIDDIMRIQSHFLTSKSMEVRKSLGQFFTGSIVSEYMASLILKPKTKNIRLLDAGAGVGILTASTALHCLELGCQSIHAVLYEIDKDAISDLKQTMNIVQNYFKKFNASFSYEIHCDDFVLARPDKNEKTELFDISVINPPYFKYRVKDSPYAKVASDLYRGDPNIYASFLAITMSCMKNTGQMITITPRSFTNGLYFKGFRSYLLTQSSLDLIHIFKYRDKVFKSSNTSILQENIICKFVKGKAKDTIVIRSSDCDVSINNANEAKYSIDLIIDRSNNQKMIRIPESPYDASILKQAETLTTTFEAAGYFISTGPVVEHRTRNFITNKTKTENTVPLYRPHNITPLMASWTGEHKKDLSFKLDETHEKHTLKNNTYVLLKRFSSKDEKCRLVSGIHFANQHNYKFIGFGNKINYIGVTDSKLSIIEAYGITAVFNSSFMDKYFRCISGNTQVNATEIRIMKFPSREQVKEIGRQAKKLKNYSTRQIDFIVNPILGIIDLV